jgi:hypothetical protein
MKTTLKSYPSWTVNLAEVSAGVFRLDAVHPSGANLQVTGTDPESLLERASDSAGQIERDIERKNQTRGVGSFNYLAEAREIRDALIGDDQSDWRTRISGAIDTGSTGTEILMAVRWNLAELLKSKPELPAEVVARIKDYILAANKLLR